jgi:signal transduction histidine kinase
MQHRPRSPRKGREATATEASPADGEGRRLRLEKLFAEAPAAIAILRGPEHTFELVNPLYTRIFGAHRDYVGHPARQVLADLDQPRLWDLLDRTYAAGETSVGVEWAVEIDRRGDGTVDQAFYNFAFQPVPDGVFVHAVEVTDLVSARRRAEEAVRARDEFLSVASHELRNPLTNVVGSAEMLVRQRRFGQLDDAALDRGINRLLVGAQRLVRLVDELLDVSRLRTGHWGFRTERIAFSMLVLQAVERAAQHTAGRTMHLDLECGDCVVDVDPDRLGQVIDNLIENAIKYSPHGDGIRLVAQAQGETVEFRVVDQGIGLPHGMAERMFEPFERGANAAAANIPGLGLGLYISRQIAERHGGSLGAESEGEGRGTTMILRLPTIA